MSFFITWSEIIKKTQVTTVVIAMIDIIPYKDLIVGDKGHVIRYKDQ